jgi:hypothetical protein
MHEGEPREIPTLPETRETNPRQEQIDRAFELEVLSRHSEKFWDEERDDDVTEAKESLLADPLREQLGEPYHLSWEGDFTLARRERFDTSGDFDPKESLAVVWQDELDLTAGRLDIEYSAFAKDKDSDGWDRRFYSVPVLKEQRLQFTASPEAIRKVYERLEAEYAEQMKKYEAEAAAYTSFSDWAKAHSGQKLDAAEWNRHDYTASFGPIAKTWEAQMTSTNGHEAVRIIILKDDNTVQDVFDYGKPTRPERSWTPA